MDPTPIALALIYSAIPPSGATYLLLGSGLIAAIYVIAMVWSARTARGVVLDRWTAERGRAPEALMVGPAPLNPFRKIVIVDAGDRYENGTFHWAGARLSIDGSVVPTLATHPAVVHAKQHPRIRAILVWARFPYFQVVSAVEGMRVTVRDMRFGSRVGSATVVVPRD